MTAISFFLRAMNAVKGAVGRKSDKALPSLFRLPLVGRTRGTLMPAGKTLSFLKSGLPVCPPGEGLRVAQTEKEVVDEEIEWELITQIVD